MRESALERKVVKWCSEHGVLTYKFVSPNNRGVPDRIIICNGHILFLELKQPGKKPTKLQLREMRRLQDAGCWVDASDNWQHCCDVLRELQEIAYNGTTD